MSFRTQQFKNVSIRHNMSRPSGASHQSDSNITVVPGAPGLGAGISHIIVDGQDAFIPYDSVPVVNPNQKTPFVPHVRAGAQAQGDAQNTQTFEIFKSNYQCGRLRMDFRRFLGNVPCAIRDDERIIALYEQLKAQK